MSNGQAIAEIIRNGILFDVKNWNKPVMDSVEHLPEDVERLFEQLTEQNIPYLVVGGIALLSYIPGRNTQDLDLVLARDAIERLEISLQEENRDFARGLFGDLQVDLLLTRNPLFRYVQENYFTQRDFAGRTIRCATVEGLILLKLYSLPSLYRQGLFEKVGIYQGDIRNLLLNYSVDLNSLLQILAPHLLESDLTVVQEIGTEIQLGIERDRDRQRQFRKESES
jgi:hypothetical protein